MKIYVGNLSRQMTVADLRYAFKRFGEVASANINEYYFRDRLSGRWRGFGFVEMPNEAEAQAAIRDLGGKELKGQAIFVARMG